MIKLVSAYIITMLDNLHESPWLFYKGSNIFKGVFIPPALLLHTLTLVVLVLFKSCHGTRKNIFVIYIDAFCWYIQGWFQVSKDVPLEKLSRTNELVFPHILRSEVIYLTFWSWSISVIGQPFSILFFCLNQCPESGFDEMLQYTWNGAWIWGKWPIFLPCFCLCNLEIFYTLRLGDLKNFMVVLTDLGT